MNASCSFGSILRHQFFAAGFSEAGTVGLAEDMHAFLVKLRRTHLRPCALSFIAA